ncbi:MAG: radical SAM protein [Eubacteriaceae bacterium]|nr:radical SAM protein [Eubacteriaceae bacterium]
MEKCNLCPRKCGVDRTKYKGYCQSSDKIKLARAAAHYWEEPMISGENGSGAIFFSGCTLGCVYCQNNEISHEGVGTEITPEELKDIFFRLKNEGCHNINLVTADHYMPLIKKAIDMAKCEGFDLPFILNTGGYLTRQFVTSLDGYIDIFLTDFKYLSEEMAKRYSKAENYPHFAKEALEEMVKMYPECVYDEDGMMKKGVVVRHLVLPGYAEESKAVLKYLWETYGDSIVYSIMGQYTPLSQNLKNHPEIDRRLTEEEYDSVTDYAWDIGIEDAFIQLPGSDTEEYIPDFDNTGVN